MPEHWSSPDGCHPNCPACERDTAACVVVLVPGSPVWWAAYAALGQYVENRRADDPDNVTAADAATLTEASTLLETFDAALAALAEDT